MSTPAVPAVTPAAGCAGTGRELARFGDLTALDAFLLGPVGSASAPGPPPAIRPSPSGLVHEAAAALPVELAVAEHLPWLAARGVRVVCAVRASTAVSLAQTAARLRAALDFSCVVGVEVDLTAPRDVTRAGTGVLATDREQEPWEADAQACLKAMAAVREQLPRGLLLTAKTGPRAGDVLAVARAAVGGGATALVLSGSVPAGTRTLLSGPAVRPVTEGLLVRVREAMAQGRVPRVPLVASGGADGPESAARLRTLGAQGVQVGTALMSDPTVLWRISATGPDPEEDR